MVYKGRSAGKKKSRKYTIPVNKQSKRIGTFTRHHRSVERQKKPLGSNRSKLIELFMHRRPFTFCLALELILDIYK